MRLPKRLALGLGGLFAGIMAAGGLWYEFSAEPSGANAGNLKLVALGRAVYRQECASCHGAHLEGQGNWKDRLPNGRLPAPPHDATGHTWHHSDKQLFDITKNGAAGMLPGYESDMPAFGGKLTNQEIWAVLAYIKSTWPSDIRARQDRINRQSNAAQHGDECARQKGCCDFGKDKGERFATIITAGLSCGTSDWRSLPDYSRFTYSAPMRLSFPI